MQTLAQELLMSRHFHKARQCLSNHCQSMTTCLFGDQELWEAVQHLGTQLVFESNQIQIACLCVKIRKGLHRFTSDKMKLVSVIRCFMHFNVKHTQFHCNYVFCK